MGEIQDYFCCDRCENRDFNQVHNFSLRFHGVNFSDDLIYDQMIEVSYLCTNCQKTFTKKEVDAGLAEIKRRHKRQR
jgi:hypothetical protein